MRISIFALALTAAGPAHAEIVDSDATGMEIKHTVRIAASPQKVWETLIQPARWWNSAHTFSGKTSNLTLEAKAGGCWCEVLEGGGSVMHQTVGFIAPLKTLVLRGALGPFFNMGVEGAMVWGLKANGADTDVTLNYRAGGYVKDGFGKWADPVDKVLSEQVAGLKKASEATP